MKIQEAFKQWCIETGHGDGVPDKVLEQFFRYYEGEEELEQEEQEKLCGTLTRPFGINTYEVAQVGHPVYETRDRYILYLKHTGKLPDLRVPFYKEDFKSLKRST